MSYRVLPGRAVMATPLSWEAHVRRLGRIRRRMHVLPRPYAPLLHVVWHSPAMRSWRKAWCPVIWHLACCAVHARVEARGEWVHIARIQWRALWRRRVWLWCSATRCTLLRTSIRCTGHRSTGHRSCICRCRDTLSGCSWQPGHAHGCYIHAHVKLGCRLLRAIYVGRSQSLDAVVWCANFLAIVIHLQTVRSTFTHCVPVSDPSVHYFGTLRETTAVKITRASLGAQSRCRVPQGSAPQRVDEKIKVAPAGGDC
jgi:hypothetical protein